jgi:hypothetical protein
MVADVEIQDKILMNSICTKMSWDPLEKTLLEGSGGMKNLIQVSWSFI